MQHHRYNFYTAEYLKLRWYLVVAGSLVGKLLKTFPSTVKPGIKALGVSPTPFSMQLWLVITSRHNLIDSRYAIDSLRWHGLSAWTTLNTERALTTVESGSEPQIFVTTETNCTQLKLEFNFYWRKDHNSFVESGVQPLWNEKPRIELYFVLGKVQFTLRVHHNSLL